MGPPLGKLHVCDLCRHHSVENYCNLCHVNLCHSCIPRHMADKSKLHEVVEYNARKENTIFLPFCKIHKSDQCETYCRDCRIPVCIQCVMGQHKKHDFVDFRQIIEHHKLQIIADTQDLEKSVDKYRNINFATFDGEFDKTISTIKNQEENICRAVHAAASHMIAEVTRKKREVNWINQLRQCQDAETLRQLEEIIQKNISILRSNNVEAIMNYQPRNLLLDPKEELHPHLNFTPGQITQGKIFSLFGFLQCSTVPEYLDLAIIPHEKIYR